MKKRTITLYGLRQMKSSLEDSVDVLRETVRAATGLRRPVAGFTQRSSLGRSANSAKECDDTLIVVAQSRGSLSTKPVRIRKHDPHCLVRFGSLRDNSVLTGSSVF